jgi:hypothetical protein
MGVPFGLRHVASGGQILLGWAAMCSLPRAAGVSLEGWGCAPVVRAFVADVPGEVAAGSPVI